MSVIGRRQFIVQGAAAVAALTTRGPVQAGSTEVDLGLVLAVDMSRSISEDEHRIPVDGYAEAFRTKEVVDTIKCGPIGVIAVTLVEWAKTNRTFQMVDWTVISDAVSAGQFASLIEAIPYTPENGTSIGGAITYAHQLLDRAPLQPLRRVIDISGDGTSDDGRLLASARSLAVGAGITINGLPICVDGHLEVARYYRDSVIGGPGAFVVIATGFDDFSQSVQRKLVLEIAGTNSSEAVYA